MAEATTTSLQVTALLDELLGVGKRLGLAPPGQGSVLGEVFHVDSVILEATISLHLGVLLPGPLGEAVVLAHEDFLTAGELELGAPQSLDDVSLELVVRSHTHEDLTNLDTSSGAVSLAESSPHSSLEPISSGTGQHFVDAENMEGVNTDPDVEPFLAAVLDEILVAADTASLQSLGGQLL